MKNIVFEDENLIVVDKPYGILSTSDSKNSLSSMLSEYRRSKGEDPYIGTIHRLDKTTRGLIIFAKNEGTAALLSDIIRKGLMTKRYYAVVEGTFDKKEGILEDLLFFDRQKNKSYVVKKERKGVKSAILLYKVVSDNKESSLLEITLITGRTHQIRVQFASRNHPVVGDKRYGSKLRSDNILLQSSYISFVNPKNNKEYIFNLDIPRDYLR